ncbi:MAG: xanthine dehydrogenase family protein subunit M [Deltaproteobacteria bacterium]|nr:xanthine dehydrogenase family protein subunit M [Deltaproteobacteria bacterium]
MIVPEFEYLVPETLREACAMLGEHGADARVLAGGSDLIVKMKHGLLKPKYLVSMKKLKELRGVRHEPGVGVMIGSRTTHNEIIASPVLRGRFPSICGAAGTMAAYQICNVGTIGGNLVNAVPSADLPPILIALDARARIAGEAGERVVALEEFFLGPGKTVLREGEILAEIVIPDQPTTGSHYIKFGLRRAGALAVVGVASSVRLAGEQLNDVRIVLGAVAPVPMRARGAEDTLRGKRPTKELIDRAGEAAAAESRPITDIRGSVEYRRHLVGVLTKRSLRAAIEKGHC